MDFKGAPTSALKNSMTKRRGPMWFDRQTCELVRQTTCMLIQKTALLAIAACAATRANAAGCFCGSDTDGAGPTGIVRSVHGDDRNGHVQCIHGRRRRGSARRCTVLHAHDQSPIGDARADAGSARRRPSRNRRQVRQRNHRFRLQAHPRLLVRHALPSSARSRGPASTAQAERPSQMYAPAHLHFQRIS